MIITDSRGSEAAWGSKKTTQCVVFPRTWPSRCETACPYGVWHNFIYYIVDIVAEMFDILISFARAPNGSPYGLFALISLCRGGHWPSVIHVFKFWFVGELLAPHQAIKKFLTNFFQKVGGVQGRGALGSAFLFGNFFFALAVSKKKWMKDKQSV